MNPDKFEPFGILHIFSSGLVLLSIYIFIKFSLNKEKDDQIAIGKSFGIFLVIYYFVECLFRYYYLNVPAAILLPFEVCSSLTFIAAYAHFKQKEFLHQISFFWTLALSFHSLLTPTPAQNFPSLEYVRYFFSHGILILNAFYVLLVLKISIDFKSALKAFAALQALIIFSGTIDYFFDLNFLFIMKKPGFPTAMDLFGPWPYYIFGTDLFALVSFFLWLGIGKILKNPRNIGFTG